MKASCSNTPNKQLIFVVALACEARALIDFYHLKRIHAVSCFNIYVNQAEEIYLIVSGVGVVASACAVGFIAHFTGELSYATYCNLGVAGGGVDTSRGDLFRINKITDHATQHSAYPDMTLTDIAASKPLVTFSVPQIDHKATYLMDMEGSGFMSAASRFVNNEQIQLIKVVSDVSAQEMQKLSSKEVSALMAGQTSKIDDIAQALLSRSHAEYKHLSPPVEVEDFLKRWHFSHYQQIQLRQLLAQWDLFSLKQTAVSFCQGADNSKTVLVKLQQYLQNLPYQE